MQYTKCSLDWKTAQLSKVFSYLDEMWNRWNLSLELNIERVVRLSRLDLQMLPSCRRSESELCHISNVGHSALTVWRWYLMLCSWKTANNVRDLFSLYSILQKCLRVTQLLNNGELRSNHVVKVVIKLHKKAFHFSSIFHRVHTAASFYHQQLRSLCAAILMSSLYYCLHVK